MDPALKSIAESELRVGQTGVYYRWSKRWDSDPVGPFKIALRSRNHEGEFLELHSSQHGDRRVSLADDEDYGHPTFYVLA